MSVPTLIIGLGGAGLEIVKRVYKRATDKQKKNIGFVVFDTDVNELRAISDEMLGIHTIQISSSLTVGEYLTRDLNARDKWFPVNKVLNSKLMTDGAGQVRAVSRLAFNTALVQGRLSPLDDAISELYLLRGDKMEQAPRIIITGSLCGGTGSGLCLPVALYTRNYLETRIQQGAAIVRGFFMLPETFFDVIEGESERDNLRSNAYAALREIDAFMMKADGTLPKEYDLHFTIPARNSREEDEYTGRPLDFCFLFDGQNMDGQELKTRNDYLDHAANCIYGMAIAPTSSRSNSSEDNVIRDIMAKKGRNRYAGAGTSIMMYPTEAIKRYLGLRWTEDIVSKEWIGADRAYKAELEDNRRRRDRGASAINLNRGRSYIDFIESGKRDNDAFCREMWTRCLYKQENEDDKGNSLSATDENKAEGYINALITKISDDVKLRRSKFSTEESAMSQRAENVKKKQESALANEFTGWKNDLNKWNDITQNESDNVARNLVYMLFNDPSDFTDASRRKAEARIEHWLYGDNGFIHPSAMRLFIYQAIEALSAMAVDAETKVVSAKGKIDKGFSTLFDDPSTSELEVSPNEIKSIQKKRNILTNGNIKGAVDDLSNKCAALKRHIDSLWQANTEMIVLKEALEYLRALAGSFENFYDAIERHCISIKDEINHMEKAFEFTEGKPLRYVCADGVCLRAMSDEIVNKNNTMDLPSELNRKIYSELRRLAMLSEKDRKAGKQKNGKEDKTTINRFCVAIFNETIAKYMSEQIEDQYTTQVNMDVLTALEQEAIYKKAGKEMTDDEERSYIKHYMVDAIQCMEKLANPFIQTPRHEQPRMIKTCTYSKKLLNQDIPIPGRADFIKDNLPHGVDSEDIDPDMILFYQAVYSIQAADLQKFAPPEKTLTTDKQAGNYYSSYHSLISGLHPDTQASLKITPHIDRWWHVITKTPELSEAAQIEQKWDILRALFWSLLGSYVKFYNDKKQLRRWYKRSKITIEGEEDTRLLVSNGTICDKLYEVQDALTIYPALVSAILKDVNEQICRDAKNGGGMVLEDTYLYQLLQEFRVDEYPLAKTTIQPDGKEVTRKNSVRSILELPLLLKRSTPAKDYNEADMLTFTDVILEELYNYHVLMFEKDGMGDMRQAYNKLLMEHFELFMEDIRLESERAKEEAAKRGVTYSSDLESDVLKDEILERLSKEVAEHGFVKDARKIQKVLSNREED